MVRLTVAPETDLSSAAWVTGRMPSFDGRARDLVPGPFEAHVRIFHRPDDGQPQAEGAGEPTWSAVARDRGTTLHPAAQWVDLVRRPEGTPTTDDHAHEPAPTLGSLDRLTLPSLRDVLARHTSTPDDCWLALWVGHGSSPDSWRSAPTFRAGGRQHWLFRAPLARIVDHSVAFETQHLADDDPRLPHHTQWGDLRSPQLWWPQDRAWTVASEIDYDSTIIGGTVALADDLLATPDIECLRIARDTSLYIDADTINART